MSTPEEIRRVAEEAVYYWDALSSGENWIKMLCMIEAYAVLADGLDCFEKKEAAELAARLMREAKA